MEHPGEIEDDIPKQLMDEEHEYAIASWAFFNKNFLQLFLDKLFLQHFPGRLKSRSEKERMIDTEQWLTFAGKKTSTV